MGLLHDVIILGGGGLAIYAASANGLLGPQAQTMAGQIRVALSPALTKAGMRAGPCPTADELAATLGVSAFRVRSAMAAKGKTGCTLQLADLQGVPELPASVMVGGVLSVPNPNTPAASWANPAPGGTWGGLSSSQIQAAYLASNNGDPNAAAAAWAADHAKEVAARGF